MSGIPSVGKSYTLKMALSLFPTTAYHEIEAGSPRVLIYDHADLRHGVVLFAEADSLPAGEDNPAASAVRNLLQDHRLHYKVVLRSNTTGQYEVQEIEKDGPTVLITTAVRSLGSQLESRLFKLAVLDDSARVRPAAESLAGCNGVTAATGGNTEAHSDGGDPKPETIPSEPDAEWTVKVYDRGGAPSRGTGGGNRRRR